MHYISTNWQNINTWWARHVEWLISCTSADQNPTDPNTGTSEQRKYDCVIGKDNPYNLNQAFS